MNYFINQERIKAIEDVKMQISNHEDMIRITSCPIKRLRLEDELIRGIDYALFLIEELCRDIEVNCLGNMDRQTKEFTMEELSNFNGSGGRPAYVAVNGVVYDISKEATWGGASHFGLQAGEDLTTQFKTCHNSMAILSKLTKVGVLK